ncbi:hypothetical protein STENM36S_07736 [Streptomyces tendae]
MKSDSRFAADDELSRCAADTTVDHRPRLRHANSFNGQMNGPRKGDTNVTTESIERPEESTEACRACGGHNGTIPDEPPETPRERVNRRWNEIMQETRVAQTGVQILFGFLLSVAFTPLFRDLGTFDHAVYVTTVISGATATASLIAPVSIHRFLSGQRMKDEMVQAAHRLMMCGMLLMAVTISCTLFLILHVVVPGLMAKLLVGGVMVWFALSWYALPLWLRRRSARRTGREG